MIKRRPFLLLAVALFVARAGTHAQWKTPWSYDGANGPEHWGDLDAAYAACKSGKQQSPIDIREAQQANLPPLKFEYNSGPLKIINNGYTAVRVNYGPGNRNFLTVADTRYELMQFHFHRPSDEYVNGKPYDMVIHFMLEDIGGKIAGVAVFLKAGSANAAIQRLWQHMPNTPGKEQEVVGVEVNPADLLPRNTAYYMYRGSLTAPPCTEGVT